MDWKKLIKALESNVVYKLAEIEYKAYFLKSI